MHATEKSRHSTCSTDAGSSHSHQDTRLTHVVSTQSTIFNDPKLKESEPSLFFSTSDAAQARSPVTTSSPQTSSTPSRTLASTSAVYLNTLLVSGQRKSWKFSSGDTVEAVRNHIFLNWPESWPQPKPESAAYLRLLHLGHILDNPDITLASRGCKAGATTVVHVIIRSVPPPEPVKDEPQSPVKGVSNARTVRNARQHDEVSSGCACVIC
ncbi:uncharacterized protein MEPE_04366 [Melanopsichium pennsylvanicum]|uniref:UBL3-like ubiquitin domain-containing protein n=2 Tax=Melanopsichium pennsylvanicum TaxID=63383 RepID=A0AAJ4XNV8_9BASI|nr:conserved hypothetical protein [Melanopsichium pennsylvanicum 4]SNX85657.1 uncharacterized protein MEPE_04366 [Melanopsichium pennsylvanicum]